MKLLSIIFLLLLFFIFFSTLLTACKEPEKKTIPIYQPGLGEFMMQLDYHHTAMGAALKDTNIARVQYEADELNEVATQLEAFHNNHEKLKQPFTAWRSSMMEQPLKILASSSSIDSLNKNYVILTANCNSCHQSKDRKSVV